MMILDRFQKRLRENYREHGVQGIGITTVETLNWGKRQTIDNVSYWAARRGSENVYEKEWDVLVLLDCARIDMMEEVRTEFEFLDDIDEHVSPGTTSGEWMKYTFTEEYSDEMRETLHITANTSSDKYLEGSDFLYLEEAWRDGWNNEHKTILPETVTDRAIALHRELDPGRTIVHYMQPHSPFVPFPDLNDSHVTGPGVGEDYGKTVAELADDYTREELWEFHVENLRYVLDSVDLLLSNIDADRVVISADHGQALGEEGEWGHPWGSSLDCLRNVPWCVTSASDSGEYDPEYDLSNGRAEDGDRLSVEQKLRYLGYKPD